MTEQQKDTVTVLTGKLTESPGEGKKSKMTRVGLVGVAAFTFLGAALIVWRPEAGAHAVTLTTISITAWTAITVGYVGAQAAVDAKTTGALTTLTSPATQT